MRRSHLRGHTTHLKCLWIHAGPLSLGLVMRQLIGIGTPRGLQDRPATVMAALLVLIDSVRRPLVAISVWQPLLAAVRWFTSPITMAVNSRATATYTTGSLSSLAPLEPRG